MRNNYYHNDRRDFGPPRQANVLRSQRHPRALRSLFVSFHVHGVMPVELERLLRAHVIMNSCDGFKTKHQYTDFNPREQQKKTHKFKCQIPNSDIFVEKELEIFESFQTQKVLKWADQFNELRSLFQWSDDVSMHVFRACLSEDIRSMIPRLNNITDQMKALLSIQFSEMTVESLYREGNRIIQEDYIFIRDYEEAIFSVARQIGVCRGWSTEMVNEKHDEYFFLGLLNITHLELTKAKVNGVDNIMKFIRDTENLLVKISEENIKLGLINCNSNINNYRENDNLSTYKNNRFNFINNQKIIPLTIEVIIALILIIFQETQTIILELTMKLINRIHGTIGILEMMSLTDKILVIIEIMEITKELLIEIILHLIILGLLTRIETPKTLMIIEITMKTRVNSIEILI